MTTVNDLGYIWQNFWQLFFVLLSQLDWYSVIRQVAINGFLFGAVFLIAIWLPGCHFWRKMTGSLQISGLLGGLLVGFIPALFMRLIFLYANFSDLAWTVFLGIIGLYYLVERTTLSLWWQAWGNLRRRHLGPLILSVGLGALWMFPSIFSGLATNNDTVLLSTALSGERYLFTAYEMMLADGLPPAHPYFSGAGLAYHYMGMVIQSIFSALGLSPLLVNFQFLPFVMAVAIAAALWWLASRVVSPRLAWVAPVSVFLWDNLGWLSARWRFPDRPDSWWITVWQEHHHIYYNGQANIFAALFTVIVLVLSWLYLSQPRRRQGVIALVLGLAIGALLLIKVQVFLVLVISLVLLLLFTFSKMLWRQQYRSHARSAFILCAASAVVGYTVLYLNRGFLLGGTGEFISWRPYHQLFAEIDSLPWQHVLIEQSGSTATGWLILFLMFSLVGTFAFNLLGFGAPFFWRHEKSKAKRLFLGGSVLVGAIAIVLQYGLYIEGSNQWQFAYTAYLVLAVPITYVLARFRRAILVAGLVTVVSFPVMGAMFAAYAFQYTELPQAEIGALQFIRRTRQASERCALVLPFEEESVLKIGDDMSINNQMREVVYPIYAQCPLVSATNGRAHLNATEGELIRLDLRPELRAVTNASQYRQYLKRHRPTYVWVAANNRYQLTEVDLTNIGYEEIYQGGSGGAVYRLSIGSGQGGGSI